MKLPSLHLPWHPKPDKEDVIGLIGLVFFGIGLAIRIDVPAALLADGTFLLGLWAVIGIARARSGR